jgi:hypothetical protein
VSHRCTRKAWPLLIVLLTAVFAGCGKKTPEPPQTLHMIAGVRTAVSAKNPDWLAQWKAKAEQARNADQLSAETAESLDEIFQLAESGDWDAANDAIIRLQKSRTPKK